MKTFLMTRLFYSMDKLHYLIVVNVKKKQRLTRFDYYIKSVELFANCIKGGKMRDNKQHMSRLRPNFKPPLRDLSTTDAG